MAESDKVATASAEQTGTLETVALGLQAVIGEECVKVVENVPVGISDGEASDKLLMPGVESGSSIRPSASNVVSGSSPLPAFSQPKKFSAVNINKKFLEKNSTASGPCQNLSSSTIVKSGSPAPRPAVQASSSHSRLVTTKLTATLPTSSTTGPGWSRPASSPSPVATTNAIPSPPITSASVTPTAAPQLPHAGKVIQPQPRTVASSVPTGGSQKDGFAGSSKPVWGNLRTAVNKGLKTDVKVQNDFPTAAEVAQVRVAKISDTKEAAETAAAHKQARMEEADTFRGVHLDPNAHHWDEMEEDDDNFLDGVIEFGDGRQYKIPTAELPPQPPSPSHELPRTPRGDVESPSNGAGSVHVPNVPVSKEERFADDFDRSWPRSKTSPPLPAREFPTPGPHPPPISPVSSQALQSPQESSRVLFNERSNRLEPYSNSHPPHRPGQSPFPLKRNTQSDILSSPTEPRSGRDLPPHTPAQSGVQLLQKHGNVPVTDFHTRPRGFSGGFGSGPSNLSANDRPRDRENYRRDDRPLSPSHPSPHSPDLKRARDHHGSFGLQPGPPGPKDRDFPGERGRRTSTMGPPALPLPSLQGKSKDAGRQLPPHLSHLPPPPLPTQRRMPSQESQSRPSPTLPRGDSSLGGASAHAGLQSPALSHVSVTSPVSDRSQVSAVPIMDIDEVRKDVMQNAAARAKQRRQQEEEEREKEKDRARRKAAELDEVRKDVMQNAAARAKQRRQQEEEEREKEKDRARRKTAELDEKIKATQAEKAKLKSPEQQLSQSQDEQVIQIIEEAVQIVEVQTDSVSSVPPVKSVHQSPNLRRPPSLKPIPRQPVDSSRPMISRRASQTPLQTPMTPSVLATTAAQAESWRSKAAPISPSTPRPVHVRESAPVFPPPPPTAVEQVESLVAHSGEDLEVVDFSEMGKFVGVPDAPPTPPVEEPVSPGFVPRPPRPIASDFFDDRPPSHDPTTPSKSSLGHWRRKPSQDLTPVVEPAAATSSAAKEHSRSEGVAVVTGGSTSNDAPHSSAALTKGTADQGVGPTQTVTVSSHPGPQRTPRAPTFYREAAMSALDDAMSRIKGALDGMQASEAPREQPQSADFDVPLSAKPKGTPSPAPLKSSKEPRWVPPALRVQHYDLESREVFHVTGCEPPRTPKPAWNAPNVHLPAFSNLLEALSKRHLHLFKSMPAPARWDILSWEPQVEGMNRRDYSLNDILFPKPQMYRGKHKYRVVLPRRTHPYNGAGAPGPKVNLPVTPKLNGLGVFGRPASANEQSTWRKPSPRKTEGVEMISELSTVSRSPPPDLPLASSSVTSMPNPSASVKDGLLSPVRSRSQPKMPAGSAVAFYRDSRIDTVESGHQTFVNFVFDSELEESSQLQSSTLNQVQAAVTLSSPSSEEIPVANDPIVKPDTMSPPLAHPVVNGVKPQLVSPEHSIPSLLVQNKAESKSSGDSTEQNSTPSTHHPNDIWTKAPLSFPIKESPARAPDPEHLKAVWSQASDKARLPAVNSLEGIADDLTALPFTLQDVKSDDGEAFGQTPPPPTSMAPSRMSLHDVTRAFQQVPSSSSSSSGHRSATISPPSATVPLVRQPSYAYSLPPPNPNLRPSYAPYPSSMMSHPPSPAVMYTHPIAHSPVPSRMPVNGHAPIYSPPVWMPLPGPAGQNHGGMMRPLTSPYPMPYPSPGTPTMYAPPPANLHSPPPQQNGSQARGRGMPLMSPVMSHAGPHQMYPGSPVLMHALPQSHAYMPMPAGRRNDNPPMQQQSSAQPSQSGFTPVPPNTFLRTAW